ncbi:STY1053 family phage-associated protein [Serratia sp. T13T92]|uniref:STY1053 family phage-associated protein n=1 Tax=Serratia sp. T13T92 TaxID=3397496 RepID=UPI0039DF92B6
MKYIVSGAASLSFADGTKFELVPGIHDGFPDEVKNHWAFSSYAKLLDEKDFEKEQQHSDLTVRVGVLESEITNLKAQLADKDNEITNLKAQLADKAGDKADHGEAPADNAKDSANAKKQPTTNK